MADDIVNRLRNRIEMYDPQRAWKVQHEAADEIEKLRAERNEYLADINMLDEVVRLLGIGEAGISPADEIRRRFGDQL